MRWGERERERERERRKWRHLSSAEIGDQFCTFPCQKFAPYYRKRGSATYIVREVRSVREREREREREIQREREREKERERERERERDGSDVTLVALNWRWILHLSIGKEFCTFLAKNLHLSFSPLAEWCWVHTFRCQKRCALWNSSCSSFYFCQMAWQGIEAPKQTIELNSGCTLLIIEKINQINTKNYWK